MKKRIRDVIKSKFTTDKSIQAEYFENTNEVYNLLLDFIDDNNLVKKVEDYLNSNIVEDKKW